MKITVVTAIVLLSATWANSHYMPRDRDRDQQRMGDDDDNESRGEDSNESEEQSREDPPPPPPQRVWTFVVDRQAYPPYSYLDMDEGRVVGLAMDILRQACEIAHQRCEYIHLKTFAPCWNGERGMSEGLMNNWFDACAVTYKSFERDLIHAFSRPYAEQIVYGILARSNDQLHSDELRREGNNVAVGFIEGWLTDRFCLQRNGFHISTANMRIYDSSEALKAALRLGEVRAAFGGSIRPGENEFRILHGNIGCALAGLSVMMRKDNAQLLDWLNPALDRVIASREYASGCYIWEKVFDAPAKCLDNMDDDGNGRLRD